MLKALFEAGRGIVRSCPALKGVFFIDFFRRNVTGAGDLAEKYAEIMMNMKTKTILFLSFIV